MKHWEVYPIKPQNQNFCTSVESGSLRWAVTDGEGDGDGDGHTICLKDADTSDLRLSADYIGRTTLKESVNIRWQWAEKRVLVQSIKDWPGWGEVEFMSLRNF